MDTMESPEIRRAKEEVPGKSLSATSTLLTSFLQPLSRRWLLRGAVAGAAGIALSSASALDSLAVHAESLSGGGTLKEFYSILATGEALFVTFYSHGVANADRLGLEEDDVNSLKAILTEEQIHFNFAVSQGGKPTTTTFSMPQGHETFEDLGVFLKTLELSENLTSGALLAWIKDTAKMGLPRIAELGGQLMQVKGNHRAVGRSIKEVEPVPNWAFAPVVLKHFTDVPAAVKAAGFLSPTQGNTFQYHAVSSSFPGVINTSPGSLS